jgi:glutamate dehydrogenase
MATVHMKPPPTNKLVDHISRSPDRMPSPQPTNLVSPNHRVLLESGTGYVAPVFAGKEEQMEK